MLFHRTAPTLVFLLMLACRLIVDWQMTGKEDEDEDDLDITASTSDIIAEQKAAAAAAAVPKGKTKSQLIKSKKDN